MASFRTCALLGWAASVTLILGASRHAHAQSAWIPTDLGTLGGIDSSAK
jgi:hypothetical protein